jgi:predicted transcriptional regulator
MGRWRNEDLRVYFVAMFGGGGYKYNYKPVAGHRVNTTCRTFLIYVLNRVDPARSYLRVCYQYIYGVLFGDRL